MSWILAAALILGAFLFMEFIAWFTHKYVMHGFLWILHKDHHIRDGRKFEWNDLFAVIFAIPSFLLIVSGTQGGFDWKFYLGLGIALYGLAYFLFHDVFVHGRLPLFQRLSNRYLRATITAHLDHHKPRAHYNYGFLIAPWKYYQQEWYKTKKA
ncbi:MAG: sterol desaturase family protein [Bacteroidales bacterium]|jgi:beta-carotene 3-hydroxylase|nr:sterol desaturase family protein [Bacteroidales bacterium]HOI32291.1 sterol desaturase family protein [Bacteroidales bacterium]